MSAHHGTHHARYALPPPPTAPNDFRLPSLKDLNFYRPQHTDAPSISSNAQPETSSDHASRHNWSRGPPNPVASSLPQHHHQQSHPPSSSNYDSQGPKNIEYSKPEGTGYLAPALPLSSQPPPAQNSMNFGAGTRVEDSHARDALKRGGRMTHNMPVTRETRPPHAIYPAPHQYAYQPSTPAYQVQTGPPPEQAHHHPSGYATYVVQQPYMQQRPNVGHHPHPHPQHPPPSQHQQHGNVYSSTAPPPPPPPLTDAWEHPQPHHPSHQHLPQSSQPPQHPQQPQMNFPRTSPLVPMNLDTRVSAAFSSDVDRSFARDSRDSSMDEIVKLCETLYHFANRYAQMQMSGPNVQVPPPELADMAERAAEVVRRLEEYRRLYLSEAERKIDGGPATVEDHRPPKRPWEDVSRDGKAGPEPVARPAEPVGKPQSAAERDMEIIRKKRAATAAGGSGSAGQPKSKYRKRSRATPPGKCHSCNIRETPEWRRGPDGARTLCNACGLHYAKLQRKRDKTQGISGPVPPIDIATLRASARSADALEKSSPSRSSKQASSSQHQFGESMSPTEPAKALPHHQTSFQLVPVQPSPGPSEQHGRGSAEQPPPPPSSSKQGSMTVPPPPWATSGSSTSAGSGRGYAPEPPHQSFMRSSQHSTGSPPR